MFNYKSLHLPANDCDEPWRRSGLAMYIKNIRKFFTPMAADKFEEAASAKAALRRFLCLSL